MDDELYEQEDEGRAGSIKDMLQGIRQRETEKEIEIADTQIRG